MSSEAITRNDLTAILNEVLPPTPSEYKKLLWTNPSPTASFAAQTISLDLSGYDSVELEMNMYTSGTTLNLQTFKGDVGTDLILSADAHTNSVTVTRLCTISSTGIYFGSGYAGTPNDQAVIPTKIYGIKYERVAPPQLEDLTIIEDLGVCNIPSTGTWTFPNVKPYKRMFICFPIWGAYNSSTLASTPIFADANQSSTTITNWTNRAGGVVTNTTVSAYVLAIRIEF